MKVRGLVGSVRARVTLAATLTVTLVLVIVGVLIVRSTAATSVGDAQTAAEIQARNLAVAVETGKVSPTLDVDSAGTTVLQVVNDEGVVEAASPQLRDMGALESTPPEVGAQKPATVRINFADGKQASYRIVTLSVDSAEGPAAVTAGVSLEPAQQAIDRLVRVMLFGLAAVLVVVASVAWLLVGWALRPVDAIRREVDTLTETDLDRRVPVPAHRDEVRDLAVTMNHMLGRLEEAADRQQAFIGDAAHELRSPIASLRAQLEVAAAHPQTVGTRQLAEDALADVIRLQALSDDLLLLARLDARPNAGKGMTADNTGARRLLPVPQALRETLAGRHGDRVPIRIEIVGANEKSGVNEGYGMVAAGRFAQVVTNLVDNAVRHAATEVTVRLYREPGQATELPRTVLSVEDDGSGIDAADRERIFERFVRLDDARSREDGGAGLGLPIARELARSLGGDLVLADDDHMSAVRPDTRFVFHIGG